MESYFLLFFTAFAAATILPFYSEVLLVSLVFAGKPPELLWLFATMGNTLGALFNWAMGRYLLRYQQHRWFPFKEKSLQRMQYWYQKFGVWSLLFAWAPIGGDALTFIAGVMKVRWWVLLILSGMGKGLRYGVVIFITLQTL